MFLCQLSPKPTCQPPCVHVITYRLSNIENWFEVALNNPKRKINLKFFQNAIVVHLLKAKLKIYKRKLKTFASSCILENKCCYI